MYFDKNNLIIKNVNQFEYNKICLISGEKLDNINIQNDNVIKLKCGHSFRYDYFLKSLKIINKHKEGYNRCPYCFSNVGRIPLIITKSKLCNIAKRIEKRELKKKLSEYKDK
tara:strand:+ start:1488 stop:1823 length:336 start_codon:yes stop_codon:yes gene_type:complete